jgi:3-oxoacyl-[acyl-carrier protein] reductase
MNLDLGGKHVLVTGASQGIGRAIALSFASEGARVSVVARRAQPLVALVAEMGGEAAGHGYSALDLMSVDGPRTFVAEAVRRSGPAHVVVHNIGGTLDVADNTPSAEDAERVWRYNAGIALDINRLVVPDMEARRWGRLVHISSDAAVTGRGRTAYGAAKAYLNAYVRSMGRELARNNVIASAIMPGVVDTPEGVWHQRLKDDPSTVNTYLRFYQPIGRMGTMAEIVPFTLLLASEHASFAAGSVIPLTGGGC